VSALSFLAAAGEAGAAVAVVAGGVEHTFGALAPRVAEAAAAARGRPFAAVVATNTLETLVELWGLIEARVPILLVHPRLTSREREELVLRPPPPRDGDERALAVVYTSGTTGRPRGAVLSRRAFLAACAASEANLGWRDGDRWLCSIPLAHVGGFSILVRCLVARRPLVLHDAPADESRPTLLSLVPTQLLRLRDAGWRPPARVRAILLGGAAAPAHLLAPPVLATYGLTEACAQVATARLASGDPALAVLPGVGVRVVDGHLQVRGPTLFSGYLDDPDPFLPDGWFDTGDLGELDGDRLVVHARRTDLIVSGGENVYPAEVERALAEHPGVAAACVVGLPDPLWGQIVAAGVVARGPVDDLDAHAAARLAPHKRPRRIELFAALPLTGAGKPDRAALARVLGAK
jgi:O-succinylbenzoic acid--CoA ligase